MGSWRSTAASAGWSTERKLDLGQSGFRPGRLIRGVAPIPERNRTTPRKPGGNAGSLFARAAGSASGTTIIIQALGSTDGLGGLLQVGPGSPSEAAEGLAVASRRLGSSGLSRVPASTRWWPGLSMDRCALHRPGQPSAVIGVSAGRRDLGQVGEESRPACPAGLMAAPTSRSRKDRHVVGVCGE